MQTTKQTHEFQTHVFQWAHGRAPRGRGSWAFYPVGGDPDRDVFFVPWSMTYTDAKKWVRRNMPTGDYVVGS